MNRYAITIALLSVASMAHAGPQLGYGLTHQAGHANCCYGAKGLDARINFGGGVTDHYNGDRWSLGLSYVNPVKTDDQVIAGPNDHLLYTPNDLPAAWHMDFSHRWYTRKGFVPFAPQLRLFVGTGIDYRKERTCAIDSWDTGEEICWNGSALVSSPFSFHQAFGFKWRERLELFVRHGSTGGFSALNPGENFYNLELYPVLFKHKRDRR